MMAEISARLCILKKWPDFEGYGFNLHGEKNKSGHFIGKIEDGSPAKSAGLCSGDRLIEVNNTNVINCSHNEVVELIRFSTNRVEMLVMTPENEKEAMEQGVVVTSSGANVTTIEAAESKSEYLSSYEESTEVVPERSEEEQRQYEEAIADSVAAAAMAAETNVEAEEEEPKKAESPEREPEEVPSEAVANHAEAPAPAPTSEAPAAPLSAAEFRAQLKSKKKNDPRQSGTSFRDKTIMFQQM